MLTGKQVVVIGGSAGIGLAVAQMALEQGASVRIGSRNPDRIDAALAILGAGAQGAEIDVSDDRSCEDFFAATGPIDHLVYTAGDWKRRKVTPGSDFDMESAMSAFDIRFWGMLRTVNAAIPQISPSGSICLTSGLASQRPAKGQCMSSAVTRAVEHLTKALALDLAPVRVNVVVPGFVATEICSRMPTDRIEASVANLPIPRAGQPAEIAESYLSLMRSTYITGQSVIVDGGMMLG